MKKIIRFFKRLFGFEIAEYVFVDNSEHVEKIRKAIERKKEKYGKGYCPCVAPKAHTDNTICPCEEYRKTGICHCGMYKK